MKPIMIVGIVLIIVGILALAYEGINYTRRETVMEVGPMHVTAETQKRLPLSPLLGGLALAGGVVLLLVGAKKQ